MQKKLLISYLLIESIVGLTIRHNSKTINSSSQIGQIQGHVHVEAVMKALRNQKLTNIIWNSKQRQINQSLCLPFVITQVMKSPYFINQLIKSKGDWPLKLSQIYEKMREKIKSYIQRATFQNRSKKNQKVKYKKQLQFVASRRRQEMKEVKQKKKQSEKLTKDYHRNDEQMSDEMREVLQGLTLEQSERLLELEVEEDD